MSPSDHHHARNGEDPGSPTETHALLPSFLPQTIHPDGESGRRGFNPVHFFKVLWRSSNQVSMAVNLLWPFCFLAIIMNYVTPHLDIWVFVVSYIGMIPAANLLGFAGQEFARKMPKVSGILIETTFVSIHGLRYPKFAGFQTNLYGCLGVHSRDCSIPNTYHQAPS